MINEFRTNIEKFMSGDIITGYNCKLIGISTDIKYELGSRLIELPHPAIIIYYIYKDKDNKEVKTRAATIQCYEIPNKYKNVLEYIDYLLNQYPNMVIGIMENHKDPEYGCCNCDSKILRAVITYSDFNEEDYYEMRPKELISHSLTCKGNKK